jgi:hypothetical protein
VVKRCKALSKPGMMAVGLNVLKRATKKTGTVCTAKQQTTYLHSSQFGHNDLNLNSVEEL